jgi:hypothetical protein
VGADVTVAGVDDLAGPSGCYVEPLNGDRLLGGTGLRGGQVGNGIASGCAVSDMGEGGGRVADNGLGNGHPRHEVAVAIQVPGEHGLVDRDGVQRGVVGAELDIPDASGVTT